MGAECGTSSSGLSVPSGIFEGQSLGLAQWICGQWGRGRPAARGRGKDGAQTAGPAPGSAGESPAEAEGTAVVGPTALSPQFSLALQGSDYLQSLPDPVILAEEKILLHLETYLTCQYFAGNFFNCWVCLHSTNGGKGLRRNMWECGTLVWALLRQKESRLSCLLRAPRLLRARDARLPISLTALPPESRAMPSLLSACNTNLLSDQGN